MSSSFRELLIVLNENTDNCGTISKFSIKSNFRVSKNLLDENGEYILKCGTISKLLYLYNTKEPKFHHIFSFASL
jgi:hypothetical protein